MHPTKVGKYLIDEKIGSGGMGTVYRAHHEETGQEAAVKVLPASLAREEGFIARFAREVSALQKLKNPHVVELLESGVDNETYFYAMQYVDGETLSALLRREKRVEWPQVIDIAMQICTALKAAHDAGVIHRDLKPSNLLIAKDGSVKLTDFGIAHVFAGTKLTATGGIIGTAEYMSPEQAQGQRVTKKSDLYSLGAVMYVMLTGRPPFQGKTTLDIIQKHRFGQFDRPRMFMPEIPHWLDEIVCKLLEKDPDKRYSDAYVLFRRLQEVVRKIELSEQEETIGRGSDAGTTPTVALGGKGGGPGGATLMRDLLKAEIEHSNRPSPAAEVLNNTWVLFALLALVIFGGYLWFSSSGNDPEDQFARGVELMERPPGPAWIEARDEYFRPLLSSDGQWADKAAPYLERIENYEAASEFWGRGRDVPQTEYQRFLSRARRHYELGEVAQAIETLEALSALLAGREDQKVLYERTQTILAELKESRAIDNGAYALLHTSMERAEELAEAGRDEEAREIWLGVIKLYAADPGAETEVEKARAMLERKVTLGR